ncbi:HD domain-containing protein [Rhizobium ruizarguesonis]|uniref:HD domain-containing protein n=1 Tax=Rhizobium ruizarguesonis TaxID=2081791 RepID=A0ACD5EMM4_9HYPH
MTDLESAISLAVKLHAGQTDKSGKPYILHPLRVMLSLDGEQDMVVGVLHDVVEDCTTGHGDILALFGEDVWSAVMALTRNPVETYEDFILRAKANGIARRVKIADIKDNMRPGAEHLCHDTRRR